MNGNAMIDILLERYVEKKHASSIEENRETAFLDLHRLIGDNKEASDALFAFQYEATRAAFYGGFATAMELVTGIRPLI